MNELDLDKTAHVGAFEASFPMMLHRSLDAVLPDYRALFSEFGLTEQQWRILRALWERTAITHNELARITLIPANSLVGILERLEKRELVVRIRSVEDRRNVIVKATAGGRALERQVEPKLAEVQARLRDRMTEDEWCSLERLLVKACTRSSTRSRKLKNAPNEETAHGRI